MSEFNTYLFFDGNCAEAMRFYEKLLNGKLHLMKVKEAPEPIQGVTNGDAVLHSRLEFGPGDVLLASDWMAPAPYPGKTGFRVSLLAATAAEARRIFEGLAKGGSVDVPLTATFFAEIFGMVTDRFGTPWIIRGGKSMP
ncbi:MAG TPA: VOC family protein [Thermoanaerobaculia bacterium]|nr:VOC family protein [Thermoanaerobaculia bacterium]